jgi:hypothetical protein
MEERKEKRLKCEELEAGKLKKERIDKKLNKQRNRMSQKSVVGAVSLNSSEQKLREGMAAGGLRIISRSPLQRVTVIALCSANSQSSNSHNKPLPSSETRDSLGLDFAQQRQY